MPKLAAQKLTLQLLEAPIPPKRRQLELRDSSARGLVAYIYPSGRVSLAVVFSEQGKRRRFALGIYRAPLAKEFVERLGRRSPDPRLTLDVARELTALFRRDFMAGLDPLREATREKGIPRFDSYVETFIERSEAESLHKPRTLVEIKRHLGRAAAAWGAMRLDLITPTDVRALAAQIAEASARNPRATRGGDVERARFLAALSAIFRSAFQDEYVSENIIRRIQRPKRPKPRQRVPDDHELNAILAACAAQREAGDVCGTLGIELLALTGARLQEALSALWRDFDLDESRPAVWTIPAENSKSNRERRLSIPPGLASLLRATPHSSEFAIAGRSSRKRSDLAGPWKRVLRAAGLANSGLRLHDLRRRHGKDLFESHGLDVASRALGHGDPSVTSMIYSPTAADYLKQPVAEREARILAFGQRKRAIS